ncbi:Cullin family-domain-containing protein [Mycena crocata]|nr:Cullin family-domain-containing protein [Mycena crocata]
MTSLLQLLNLPAKSKAFTALPDSITDIDSSPPTKTPRRDNDSDSPSAARNTNTRANQPIKIQVVGSEASRRHNASRTVSLQQCIKRLLARDNEGLQTTYESIFSECLSVVCVFNTGEALYATLKLELEQFVSRLTNQLLSDKKVDDLNSAGTWVNKFVVTCNGFETKVALLESLLTYLDQVYIRRGQLPSIRQLAFSLFVRKIYENPELMQTLRHGVRILVTEERNSKKLSKKTKDIPALITHLYTHQQYSVFEEYYRDITWKFYEKESEKLAEEMKDDPKGFFTHVQKRIEEEAERSKKLLPVGSWGIIQDATLKSLLGGRMQWIAEETLGDYLDKKDFKSLKTMNQLFTDAQGATVICAVFKTHTQKTVQMIVKDPAADDTMVERLLEVHAIADSAIKECFLEESVHVTDESTEQTSGSTSSLPPKRPKQEFLYALSDAFTIGFRARRNKPAEMIARHLDKLMRKGQGAMSDAKFDALLDLALGLYRFTDDKDVFRGFYLRALAKRLLLEKSASHDFEAAVLKKLKDEYDPEFSMGGEMFSDLALSREAMVEYHSTLPSDSEGHKLSVMVLKQGAWPYSDQATKIALPPSMQAELDAFEKFYKKKHTGRKLTWQFSVATVTMSGRFKAGKKELSVSLYQSAVLLLFNRSPELSFSEILQETQLSDPLARLTLQSLACGKKKVLLKQPAGRDVNDGDMFRFNDGFIDPRAKVHINSIQAKVTAEESKQTQTAIDGERSATLDAAIVRIMKAKKEMLYENLVNATIDAVKGHFTPEVKTIKARIDKLMEQEYVRRDDDKPQMMVYMA